MYINRIVIRNFRSFDRLDVSLTEGVSCIVGENNTGKTNLIHAIRMAIDVSLSSYHRQLTRSDVHTGVDLSSANQVLISLELTGYAGKVNEEALVGSWAVADDVSRITYRFRPKLSIREEFERDEPPRTDLTLDDYEWELTCSGDKDPATVEWHEDIGSKFRYSDLQEFQVVCLPPLRDVEYDLKQIRSSPLSRLLETSGLTDEDKAELVGILSNANDQIATQDKVKKVGEAIDEAFASTAGEAHPLSIRIGTADPDFSAVSRSLTLLLSTPSLKDFETGRNGLGINNVLYMSMLIEYFERRIKAGKTAGQLLLVEEPEAHLHPQLQRTLYKVLKEKPFQTIISTHSTHVTSAASLNSIVTLTNRTDSKTAACSLADGAQLDEKETADLERYLDATRSALLFARKVILVEGPAELFLIAPLVLNIKKIDLDRRGISVVPIHGTHFDVYAKLFTEGGLEKPCAIIADADLTPDDDDAALLDDDVYGPPDLDILDGSYVKVFKCPTTFERALTTPGCYSMLLAAAKECGAKKLPKRLEKAIKLINEDPESEELATLKKDLPGQVLALAKKVGKARFAQIASKHVSLCTAMPKYIWDAVDWLVSQ